MKNERKNERAGRYSCGVRTNGYGAVLCALAGTKVNTYRTSSIPMADFWRPENLCRNGAILEEKLTGIDLTGAEKVFECPTEPVRHGKILGKPSMTDLMIRDGQYQIAIEGKYTEYTWGASETLGAWLLAKPTSRDIAYRRRIAKAWLDMIGQAQCTDLNSFGELFRDCGEIGYQFLHRTASACHRSVDGKKRMPVLVYQLFYDADDAVQIAARDTFKGALRRWAQLLKLKNMRFLVMEVPVTNGRDVEARTTEFDKRIHGHRSNIFKILEHERIYGFDFSAIVLDDMLCKVRGEMMLSDVKEALDNGGRVTILIRHAERPPLEEGDTTFGANLALTERGWRMARQFGAMLANAVQPKSVAFYASGTFRTIQTAFGMAMGLDAVNPEHPIVRQVRLAEVLGTDSPFFGSLDDRMALIAEGRYHERLNEYFSGKKMRGYRPLGRATGEMDAHLHTLHRSAGNLVVAVTHDINVAAFLAGRGVVASFTDETWPDYLDAAVVIEGAGGKREYGFMRWNKDFEGIDLLDMRYA